MSKIVKYKNRQIELISRKEFGEIVGVSVETIKKWIQRGVILPPAFQDSNNTAYNFGRGAVPRKFYVKQEAVGLREVVRQFDMGHGKKIQKEFIDSAIEVMLHVRKLVNEAHPSIEEKKLVLEFASYSDFHKWLKNYFAHVQNNELESISQTIFNDGDKFI